MMSPAVNSRPLSNGICLLLFNREGDCLAAKLRPGNVHSAEDWEELLLPEIEGAELGSRRERTEKCLRSRSK
jgi:hypothetical protein